MYFITYKYFAEREVLKTKVSYNAITYQTY